MSSIQHQAKASIASAIRRGDMVRAVTLACIDCGQIGRDYDHYLGYERKHWLDVQVVCRSCHLKRAWARGEQVATEHRSSHIRRVGFSLRRSRLSVCYSCFQPFQQKEYGGANKFTCPFCSRACAWTARKARSV